MPRGPRNNYIATTNPPTPLPIPTVTNIDRRISCLPTNQLHLITEKSIKIFANACNLTYQLLIRLNCEFQFATDPIV